MPNLTNDYGLRSFSGKVPFTGRSSELFLIGQLLEKVRLGQGKMLLLSGPPGIGKTRLMWEARKRFFGGLSQLEASCDPHSKLLTLHLFRRLLKSLFQVQPQESSEKTSERIQNFFEHYPELKGKVEKEHLLVAMGFPVPAALSFAPEEWKRRTQTSLSHLFKAISKRNPLVIILDDCQWADTGSLEMIQELAGQVSEVPFFFCAIHRDDLELKLVEDQEQCSRLELKSLSREEAQKLAQSLVGGDALPDSVTRSLATGAELSPLYVEEVVRTLTGEDTLVRRRQEYEEATESDVSQIPENLEEIIVSRMNRLGEGTRAVLQAGAVLGQEFALDLLELLEVAREGLRDKLSTLRSMGFLKQEQPGQPSQYAFHHWLTQEIVYGSLGPEEKRKLHIRVTESLLKVYGEEDASHAPLIAYHATQAGMYDTAVQFLEKSAESARQRYAAREAIEFYSQLLGLLTSSATRSGTAERIVETLLRRAGLHRWLGDIQEAGEDLRQAAEVTEELDLTQAECGLRIERAQLFTITGQYAHAKEEIHKGWQTLRSVEENAPHAMRLSNLEGLIAWRQGEFEVAREAYMNSIEWAEKARDEVYVGNAYNNLGLLCQQQADYPAALENHQKALEIRKKNEDRMGEAASLNNIGIVQETSGDWDSAEKSYQQALELAEEVGYREVETAALANLGQLAMHQGTLPLAMELNARSFESARRSGDRRSQAIALDNLGDTYSASRQWPQAVEHYERALELAEEIGDRDCVSRCCLGRCLVEVENRRIQKAEVWFSRAKEMIESLGLKDTVPRMLRASGRLHLIKGEQADAVEQLQAGKREAQRLGQIHEVREVERILGRINFSWLNGLNGK